MGASNCSCRVLYVEDNPADAYLLQSSVSELDPRIEITLIHDGEEALEFVNSKPFLPDVFVLDLHIPRVDGLTVLEALKADATLKSIPVMVFVYPDSPNSIRARSLGANVCVAKPIGLDGYRELASMLMGLCPLLDESAKAAGSS